MNITNPKFTCYLAAICSFHAALAPSAQAIFSMRRNYWRHLGGTCLNSTAYRERAFAGMGASKQFEFVIIPEAGTLALLAFGVDLLLPSYQRRRSLS